MGWHHLQLCKAVPSVLDFISWLISWMLMQSMSVVVKMFSACFCFFLGTGKTVVGTHIVYWFHKLNEESVEKDQTSCLEGEKHKKRKCILYCGPSNKSVDVVAGNYRLLSP